MRILSNTCNICRLFTGFTKCERCENRSYLTNPAKLMSFLVKYWILKKIILLIVFSYTIFFHIFLKICNFFCNRSMRKISFEACQALQVNYSRAPPMNILHTYMDPLSIFYTTLSLRLGETIHLSSVISISLKTKIDFMTGNFRMKNTWK